MWVVAINADIDWESICHQPKPHPQIARHWCAMQDPVATEYIALTEEKQGLASDS